MDICVGLCQTLLEICSVEPVYIRRVIKELLPRPHLTECILHRNPPRDRESGAPVDQNVDRVRAAAERRPKGTQRNELVLSSPAQT